MKDIRKLSPSELYKLRRPEYFSDSEVIYEVKLPKEHLSYEISQITTNQKQNEFEILCLKLSEKFIAPNLIPQTGPTGGGDGKTDTETYPVSNDISDRWFIPENGWNNNEKWAFAFSAKKDWKTKVEDDVKNILSTKREYTRIYFITNQTPSSKKKKEKQDDIKDNFGIEVVILDGKWILEKVYDSDLIDLAVDSLNLSNVFKNKKITLGQNDASRIQKLKEIEEKINNLDEYFDNDFQLVEDTLEAAILSRMLEKPRDEVEGKFDRAFRFCEKVNNKKQWIRLHYQRAWTYLNFYDDYYSFVKEFKCFKKYISKEPNISEIELYFNLINLLRGLSVSGNCDLSKLEIDLKSEIYDLEIILIVLERNDQKPSSALIANTFKTLQKLMDCIAYNGNPDQYLKELSNNMSNSNNNLDYPFDVFKKIIEELGSVFPDSKEFDNLIDDIASFSEKRTSELTAGLTFLKRGRQKLYAKSYKDSIVYFGKAVLKLAKEESQYGMYYLLIGLSQAYGSLGLFWASNNCLVTASSISFKSLSEKGVLNKNAYYCIKELAINELFIGRIPSFLSWHELLLIISRKLNIIDDLKDISTYELIDACLSIRIITSNFESNNSLSYLPDLLENQSLWLSQNACLYKLGHIDLILDDYIKIGIKNEKDLDKYFEMVANQPFINQIIYKTNFLTDNEINLSSTILGCKFNFYFKKDIELLLAAETFLAFFESFLATSLTNVYPSTELINIELIKNPKIKYFNFLNKESSNEYKIEINQFNLSENNQEEIWISMLDYIINLLSYNFYIINPKEYLENMFKKEEINERLSLIFEHRKLVFNILGEIPKLFFNDWTDNLVPREYPMKRKIPISFNLREIEDKFMDYDYKLNADDIGHNKRIVFSIIDINLWNQAIWRGFGSFEDSRGIGVMLLFENGESGIKIFENWIKKVGTEDNDELIKITIIKGVDKNNPFWYRIHIGSNINEKSLQTGKLFLSTSKIHEMNAINNTNLDNLINRFNILKKYKLYPAKIYQNGKVEPYFDISILKRTLFIRNAWEIGEHDPDRIVIKEDDTPIIPDYISDAPVLKLLKK